MLPAPRDLQMLTPTLRAPGQWTPDMTEPVSADRPLSLLCFVRQLCKLIGSEAVRFEAALLKKMLLAFDVQLCPTCPASETCIKWPERGCR